MLAPRRAYASSLPVRTLYILYYIVFVSVLIAACASVSATGRVTLGLMASLAVSWMFVPLLHALIAAMLVASAAAKARTRGSNAIALLLVGHAPWSLWLLLSAIMIAMGGYRGYQLAALIAIGPLLLTCRIIHAFCMEVLQTTARGAAVRTLLHQAVTWLIAAIYLEKAVGLMPRIYGWLS